ncbi:hypothetical protein BH20VER1_BH20VER1_04760 [soil metagenome]
MNDTLGTETPTRVLPHSTLDVECWTFDVYFPAEPSL